MCTKTKNSLQNTLNIDDFGKQIGKNPEETVEVFNQLSPIHLQHGFQMKKWISKKDSVPRLFEMNQHYVASERLKDENPHPSSWHRLMTKAVILWKRFKNFNRLVNTVAYLQRALSNYKSQWFVVSDKDMEKTKAIIFRSLQREQFGEEKKSLNAEREIPNRRKILLISPFIDEKLYFWANGRIGKT